LLVTINIPNNVTPTYTGVIYAAISLTFYSAEYDSTSNYSVQSKPLDSSSKSDKKQKNKQPKSKTLSDHSFSLPIVTPLTKAPGVLNNIYGSQNLTFVIPDFSKDLSDLFVDIYASNHGCEEFYYSNVPDEYASQYGACGGGVYREIQVLSSRYTNLIIANIS